MSSSPASASLTPLGCGVEATWKRLIEGKSGVRRVEKFDVSDLPSKIAGIIPHGDGSDGTFNADHWMEPKEQRKVDDFILYAMCATRQALDDACWKPSSYEDQTTTGVLIGSGIGGVEGIAETAIVLKERGPRRVSPFFIPGRLINLAAGYASIEFGLKGPTTPSSPPARPARTPLATPPGSSDLAMPRSWWQAGANHRSIAFRLQALRRCARFPPASTIPLNAPRDPTTRTATVSSWGRAPASSCSRSTSTPGTRRQNPRRLVGYGTFRATPSTYRARAPMGTARSAACRRAIRRAKGDPSEIDYINAHGTSTPLGDEIELCAVHRLVGNAAGRISMSSTKSSHRPSARRGWCGRSDLFHPGDARPGRTAHHQSRQSVGRDADRPRAPPGAQARNRHGAVEFIRIWRDQRVAHVSPRRAGVGCSSAGRVQAFAFRILSFLR